MNPQPLQARAVQEHAREAAVIATEDAEYGAGGGDDEMEELEEISGGPVNPASNHTNMGGGGGGGAGVVGSSRTSELTLSFEGEVYVFPAVTPEKVSVFDVIDTEHAVFLMNFRLLGAERMIQFSSTKKIGYENYDLVVLLAVDFRVIICKLRGIYSFL